MEPPNDKPGPSAPSGMSNLQHFALPVPKSYNKSQSDDSEEWEYEYSTTETETYYLTLDLTTPFTTTRRLRSPIRGRGVFRSKWINPGLGRKKRQLGRASAATLPNSNPISSTTPASFATPDAERDEENDEDQERDEDMDMDAENEEADGGFTFPADLINKLTKSSPRTLNRAEPDAPQEEIQILELHSENPVIVYRNQVFSCNWAENIGTELLFARRDANRPLEALRQLPDNVDLLAASSVRLLGSLATMEPKTVAQSPAQPAQERGLKGKGRAGVEESGEDNSDAKKAEDARSQQAQFLERLTKAKERKGEKDEVTMVAKQRVTHAAWKSLLKQKRKEEKARLRRISKMGGPAAEQAVRKLKEMGEEDGVRSKAERGRGNAKERAKAERKLKEGQVVRRPRANARAKAVGQGMVGGKAQSELGPGLERPLSTPTPARWGDLREVEGGKEGDSEDSGEGDSGDEDGSEMDVDNSNG